MVKELEGREREGKVKGIERAWKGREGMVMELI